jgi:hypothetical protein
VTESASESVSESEIQLLDDLWGESESHLGIQSGIQSEHHSQSDSKSDSRIELRTGLPNADAYNSLVSVQRSAPRAVCGSLSITARMSGDSRAAICR